MNITADEMETVLARYAFPYDEQPIELTGTEIEDEYGDVPEFSWDDFADALSCRHSVNGLQLSGFGVVRPLVCETGCEGGGEHCEIVFEVTHLDGSTQLFEKDGCYFSYDGTTWDGDFFEVTSRRTVVMVYDRKRAA